MTAHTHILYQVGTDDLLPLTVQRDLDCADYVEIAAIGDSLAHWSPFAALTMPREMAIELGRALIACAGGKE